MTAEALTATYTPDEHPEAVAAAIGVFARFITAFNTYDYAAMAEVLHFPHYRLKGGAVMAWHTAAEYLDSAKVRIGPQWQRSVGDFCRPLAASADKVHLDVQWTRFDANDKPYLRFRALWVIARIDGRWGAQLRSSFEP